VSERLLSPAICVAMLLLIFLVVPLGLHLQGGGYAYQLACLVLIFSLLSSSLHWPV